MAHSPPYPRGSGVGVSELVHKCDITKIQTSEIMRFVSKLFRKNKMKKAPLPKTSFLNCLTLMIQALFRRIYMESSEHNLAYISSPV